MSKNQTFFRTIGDFAADYWLPVLIIILPLLSTLATAFIGAEATTAIGLTDKKAEQVQRIALWALVGLLIVHIILSIINIKFHKRESALLRDLANAREDREILISNATALCEGFLQDLAEQALSFGSNALNSERITLYVHNAAGQFRPIGRFSWNQSYKQKGRQNYPDNQGCIGEAWKNDWFFKVLPSPAVDEEAWVLACQQLNVPKGVSRNINMKSALYCACSVKRVGSSAPVGVVVVESTDPQRYQEDDLRVVLSDDRRNYIGRMVETLRPWLGDEDNAKKKGF